MSAGVNENRQPPRLVLPQQPRILVVSLRRIGDVLLTTPLIRSLRRAWPDATIEALVFANTVGILTGNPDLNRIIPMPTKTSALETLKLAASLWRRYDLAITTQTGDRPTFFAAMAGKQRVGVADTGRLTDSIKRLVLQRHVPYVPDIHSAEQMLRVADALGIARVPQMVPPAGGAQDIPSGKYAVIHATPMFRYKAWTAEGWRSLAASLEARGLSVVPIGGPGETERNYLRNIWQDRALQQVGWPATVTLLDKASVFIGPDTSVTHLAAATGCPTVALFGPMDPQQWGPWPVEGLAAPWAARGTIQNRGNVWVVQNPLPCLPCKFEGCDRHTGSHSQCLDELTPQQVLAATEQALATQRAVA